MNKVSIVVGGSGGIGLESAKRLLRNGNHVCVWGNKNIEKIKSELNSLPPESYELYRVDLLNDKEIFDSVVSVINEHGSIDSVIYSVSASVKNSRIENLDWLDFQSHIDIQVKGFFNLVKAIMKNVKQEQRVKFIVLLTEYCFGKPPSNLAHYIVAKHGLMGLLKSLASELDATKYTFNMISPGMVDTDLISNLPPKFVEVISHNNPMKRIATPEDIANIVSFLDSEESNYMNGVNILINGGSKFT